VQIVSVRLILFLGDPEPEKRSDWLHRGADQGRSKQHVGLIQIKPDRFARAPSAGQIRSELFSVVVSRSEDQIAPASGSQRWSDSIDPEKKK
jgi:hypothetical protein